MDKREIIEQVGNLYKQIETAKTIVYQDNLKIEIGRLLTIYYYESPKNFDQIKDEYISLESLLNEEVNIHPKEIEFLQAYINKLKRTFYNLEIQIIRNWLNNVQGQELNKLERLGMENAIKIISQHISKIDNNYISDECIKDLETLENITSEFKGRGIDTQRLNDISSAEQVVYHTTKEYLNEAKKIRK